MQKKWVVFVASGVLVLGLAAAGAVFARSDKTEISNGTIRVGHQPESQFPTLARVAPGQAVVKALAAVPGQVLETALEDENGFLVYTVEVVTADKAIVEVKVDAGSGKVLAMGRDRGEDESHETGERDHREDDD